MKTAAFVVAMVAASIGIVLGCGALAFAVSQFGWDSFTANTAGWMIGFSVLGLAGGLWARIAPKLGAVCMVIAAIVLVGRTNIWGVPLAILFVIAAGLAFFADTHPTTEPACS